MAAQFVDALKGYEYFLQHRGKVTLENINEFLKESRRNPIHERTFNHYGNLLKHGFRSYVPINQFDVFRTLGRLQMASDRRRYVREEADIDAEISLDRNTFIQTNIINRSPVGFGIKTKQPFPLKYGRLVWVRIPNYHDMPTIVIWKRSAENIVRFGLRCIEFIDKYQIYKEEVLFNRLTGLIIVSKISHSEIQWSELFRIMSKVDELVEASSILIYSIAEAADVKIKVAKPIIASIRFESPGNFQLKIDASLTDIVKFAVEKAQLWSLEKERYRVQTKKLELDNDKQKLEHEMVKIEAMRNAIRLRKEAIDTGIPKEMADYLLVSFLKALNIRELPSTIFEPDSPELGIIKGRLLPAAAELGAGDDPDFKIEVHGNSS
ncbi:MAG: PilZ domain-containing protein [Desulfobaccales bacterium]